MLLVGLWFELIAPNYLEISIVLPVPQISCRPNAFKSQPETTYPGKQFGNLDLLLPHHEHLSLATIIEGSNERPSREQKLEGHW